MWLQHYDKGSEQLCAQEENAKLEYRLHNRQCRKSGEKPRQSRSGTIPGSKCVNKQAQLKVHAGSDLCLGESCGCGGQFPGAYLPGATSPVPKESSWPIDRLLGSANWRLLALFCYTTQPPQHPTG
ncbi:uncharacterized protein LOC115304892 isoform X2 [Suricata suricatta]|uniref:uncharacterized protein LOC115304892 isoform X2 n=1 Tax=Suricata suricatta TaxID=37032 RepID=UPI00115556F6|nr:uncharacterized protein LOC115304892 isoform X2 [Suricata suricatta]